MNALAVYNGAALSGQASADYLTQRRIPVVGEEGAQPWICYSPNGFPVMSSCNEGIQGIYQVLAQVDEVACGFCSLVASRSPHFGARKRARRSARSV